MTLDAMVYGLPAPPSVRSPRLVGWRRSQLVGAGFDEPLATEFAEMYDLDLHALLDLVEQGWPPRLAARALEPISGSSQ